MRYVRAIKVLSMPSIRSTATTSARKSSGKGESQGKNRFVGQKLVIRGARQHNLKNLDIDLPKRKLIVVTGPSGSGKSSLVFDTIYAEGQRRYVESLSSYARQFLERMDKPDVDLITGLAPAIAIEQQTGSNNPRSTVATQTEIYDYLRLLFARIGTTYSPVSGEPVTKDSPRSVAETLQAQLPENTRFYLTFPIQTRKGRTLADELTSLHAQGFFRIVALPTASEQKKGAVPEILDLNEIPPADVKVPAKRLLVLVDRLAARSDDEAVTSRIADSAEQAFAQGMDSAVAVTVDGNRYDFSSRFERDGRVFEEPTPQLFSFNSPLGACPECQGFGRVPGIDPHLVIPNPDLSIRQGAIAPFRTQQWGRYLKALIREAVKDSFPLDTPYSKLTEAQKEWVWDGSGDYAGIRGLFDFIESKRHKAHYRIFAARFRGYYRCPECDGFRLREEALLVRIGGKPGEPLSHNIGEVCELTTADALGWVESLTLSEYQQAVAGRALEEIRKRLRYLVDVGLDYISLDRLSQTLSGGESQRIHLATSLGSSLVGSLYVLDEPTIGLHPRDNERLIRILEGLRDLGNTVLVVEHDAAMMQSADHLVDIGPVAGRDGGYIVFQGSYEEILTDPHSITGAYLSEKKAIPVPESRREVNPERVLEVRNARENNLKRLDVTFPLDMIVCVTGVSGSGKSTLVNQTLGLSLMRMRGVENDATTGAHDSVRGHHLVGNVEIVDQSPIGRSPRSNPVTYIKAFDHIRELLADTHQAKIRGYKPGAFSFNVPGGRCEVCQGDGVIKVEMQFMADLYLECEACRGRRFKQEILDIRFQGKNVDDILQLTVDEAISFFNNERRIVSKLRVLQEVGLGYLQLGQPSSTLSGGEAQRVKLANHLARPASQHTLYLFDEPTTGLHFADIDRLLYAFNALVDHGHSVILIEHNIDVVKSADYVIDLGPEGGRRGGFVVAAGTPEELAAHPTSHTGRFLRNQVGIVPASDIQARNSAETT